jgi:hypothetical protein
METGDSIHDERRRMKRQKAVFQSGFHVHGERKTLNAGGCKGKKRKGREEATPPASSASLRPPAFKALLS